jgi:carbonic anhydrase/acetyltransferase-like protein (isoleucine patch superfamily)
MTMNNLRKYRNNSPQIDRAVYIDSTATIIGDVEIGADSSVWPQSVIRGDVNRIRVGARSNIQDGCIIHVSRPTSSLPDGHPTLIANDVTIGHGTILHGCSIACCVLVGNGAVVMDGVCIESHVIVGANSLVPPGKTLSSGYLYIGSPCQQARKLTDAEIQSLQTSANNYVALKDEYLDAEKI